jgi:hypothetical protein
MSARRLSANKERKTRRPGGGGGDLVKGGLRGGEWGGIVMRISLVS